MITESLEIGHCSYGTPDVIRSNMSAFNTVGGDSCSTITQRIAWEIKQSALH